MIRNKVVWDKHYYSNRFTVRNIFLLRYSRFRLMCTFKRILGPGYLFSEASKLYNRNKTTEGMGTKRQRRGAGFGIKYLSIQQLSY